MIIILLAFLFASLGPFGIAYTETSPADTSNDAILSLQSKKLGRQLKLDGMFYETSAGRVMLPRELTATATNAGRSQRTAKMNDGRVVTLSVRSGGPNHFILRFGAKPDSDIVKWGLAVDALRDEYYTGLMERVVDGPQRLSWAPGIKEAMDLRGQKVEMILRLRCMRRSISRRAAMLYSSKAIGPVTLISAQPILSE